MIISLLIVQGYPKVMGNEQIFLKFDNNNNRLNQGNYPFPSPPSYVRWLIDLKQ